MKYLCKEVDVKLVIDAMNKSIQISTNFDEEHTHWEEEIVIKLNNIFMLFI